MMQVVPANLALRDHLSAQSLEDDRPEVEAVNDIYFNNNEKRLLVTLYAVWQSTPETEFVKTVKDRQTRANVEAVFNHLKTLRNAVIVDQVRHEQDIQKLQVCRAAPDALRPS